MTQLTYIHTLKLTTVYEDTKLGHAIILMHIHHLLHQSLDWASKLNRPLKRAWGSRAHFLGELDHTAPVWKDGHSASYTLIVCFRRPFHHKWLQWLQTSLVKINIHHLVYDKERFPKFFPKFRFINIKHSETS